LKSYSYYAFRIFYEISHVVLTVCFFETLVVNISFPVPLFTFFLKIGDQLTKFSNTIDREI